MSKVEYTPKTVIENKLLAALDDEGTVAILLNQSDLQMLITALALRPHKSSHMEMFLEDMRKLYRGAFPEAKDQK